MQLLGRSESWGNTNMSSKVTLIESQNDVTTNASSERAQHGALYLTLRDTCTLFTKLYLFPLIFVPFRTKDPNDELYIGGTASTIFGSTVLVITSVISLIWLGFAVPLLLILPGAINLIYFSISLGILHLACWFIQGPIVRTTSAQILQEIGVSAERSQNERWVFINGICTTGHGFQENVDRLSLIFGRPIIGVHNKTYGMVGDVIECIVQRSFGYYTEDTRVAYAHVKAYCNDPLVKKLVLIAHSQGGIIVSNILDQLYADVPNTNVSKLEVYTFGNAASHFNNPYHTSPDLLKSFPSTGAPAGSSGQMIPYIEHYANGLDMVTRWGVLYSVRNIQHNRFSGKVFVHNGATGHLLNQHYLQTMFPLPDSGDETAGLRDESSRREGYGTPHNGSRARGHSMNGSSLKRQTNKKTIPFLDQLVDIEVNPGNRGFKVPLLAKNATTTNGQSHDPEQDLESGSHNENANTNGTHSHEDTDDDLLSQTPFHKAEDTTKDEMVPTGKTVRELSRLWKYMGGKSPED